MESFFTELIRRRLKRGVFQSIRDLKPPSTVSSPKPTPNQNPSGPPIQAAVKRGKQALELARWYYTRDIIEKVGWGSPNLQNALL